MLSKSRIILISIMASFEQLGLEAHTDKIWHHGYHRFYPRYLESLRNTATGILEIGIDHNCSVNLWLNYFPKAQIYGIDIGLEYESDRVKIFRGDQSSLSDLQQIRSKITEPLQFIIDDGSHIPEHQLLTFDYFFQNLLEPGGVYIVEDIETSYWKNGFLYGYTTHYGYRSQKSFIERVKPLVDSINKEFLNADAKEQNGSEVIISQETQDMISTMTFGQNCVIFTKKLPYENEYTNRQYRGIANI